MDRKLNKRIADYVSDFKKAIKIKIIEQDYSETTKIQDLISFVYEYDRLVLSKEDVSKRKRIKNTIPVTNRCHAKRASGEQCTRKQKEGNCFCGTHVKGTPHGIINNIQCTEIELINTEVFATDIGGIVYYLDKNHNVFSTEDVLAEKTNPKIIAKYAIENESYRILWE